MTHEQQRVRYEESVEEWLEELPRRFDYGPIALWEVVDAGRDGFGLDGSELTAFVGKAVRRVLECGARPVARDKAGPYYWTVLRQYGDDPADILGALADGAMSQDGDPDRPGLCFATPDMWTIPNETVEAWLARLPSRLADSPVTLLEIALEGRVDYDRTGADLVDFARQAMRRLMESGARPFRINLAGEPAWMPVQDYGETIEAVLDGLIAEWSSKDVDGLMTAGLAFGLPEPDDA